MSLVNVGNTALRGSWSDCNKASIYVVSVWSWLQNTARVGPRKPQLLVGSYDDAVTSVGTGACGRQLDGRTENEEVQFLRLVASYVYVCIYIQGVPGGMCETSGECSLC